MESTTFAGLPLGPKLQAAISAAGYANPTPIQAQAIPVAVTGRDVLGIAQTGTGKTASFVLPMIERLESGLARARMPRSLILAPTRELAAQVAQSFEKYGINHKLALALLIGGVSMEDQVRKLDRGVDVLIATPGRLLDHFGRGKVMLMGVEILVIDEADRMLDMGFIPDIEKICKLLPPVRQTLFFSATMPPEIQRLVDTFLKDPARIEVARPATTAKTITQRFRFCASSEDWEKRELLRELIHTNPVKNAIIFCNRKKDVAILHKSLTKHGFNAGALHGDMDQKARMETLDKFRNGEILLLAASDVAARGLDIPDVSHIFNFDIPWAGDDYVHRIGRTGRAGKEGVSLSIVTPEDLKLIKDIEKVTGETPQWIGDPPTEADFADSGKRRGRGRGGARGGARGESRGGARGESRGRPARGGGRGEARADSRGEARAESRGEARAESRGEARAESRGEGLSQARTEPRSETSGFEGGRRDRSRQRTERAPRPETGEPPRERQPRREREPRPQRAPVRADVAALPGFGDQPVVERAPHADRAPLEPRREPAEPREHRTEHRGERWPQRRPDSQPATQSASRPEHQHREPRAERSHEHRDEPRRRERPQREQRAGQAEPAGVGFADNVPAFLRRPVRPAKVATE